MSRGDFVLVIPGPWTVGVVERPDAAGLYNAIRLAPGGAAVEADCTPTHSERLALALASDLNRRFHEASGLPVPEATPRFAAS